MSTAGVIDLPSVGLAVIDISGDVDYGHRARRCISHIQRSRYGGSPLSVHLSPPCESQQSLLFTLYASRPLSRLICPGMGMREAYKVTDHGPAFAVAPAAYTKYSAQERPTMPAMIEIKLSEYRCADVRYREAASVVSPCSLTG